MTPEELKTLISKYGDTDKMAQSGVTIAGVRYMYLSSTDRVVRAKKGTNGVHAIKTQQSKFFSVGQRLSIARWFRGARVQISYSLSLSHRIYKSKLENLC